MQKAAIRQMSRFVVCPSYDDMTEQYVIMVEGFLLEATTEGGRGPIQVTISPGLMAKAAIIDSPSSTFLTASKSNPTVNFGISLMPTIFSLMAPDRVGYAVEYMIQAAFGGHHSLLLDYYNLSNPSVAFYHTHSAAVPGIIPPAQWITLTLKGGAPGPIGTQPSPAMDADTVVLATITVATEPTRVVAETKTQPLSGSNYGSKPLPSGQLLNVQKWDVAGTAIYVPTPGTKYVTFEVYGGGASGGSCAPTSPGEISAGSGGESGAYVRHRATSDFADAIIVVGAGGAASPAGANNGNSGGTSRVAGAGLTLIAPGGLGGLGGVALPSGFLLDPAPTIPSGSGGNLVNRRAGSGRSASGVIQGGGAYYLVSGDGGPSYFGHRTRGVGGTNKGRPGVGPGGGGSGAASGGYGTGGAAQAGGAGNDGIVLAWEYS